MSQLLDEVRETIGSSLDPVAFAAAKSDQDSVEYASRRADALVRAEMIIASIGKVACIVPMVADMEDATYMALVSENDICPRLGATTARQ